MTFFYMQLQLVFCYYRLQFSFGLWPFALFESLSLNFFLRKKLSVARIRTRVGSDQCDQMTNFLKKLGHYENDSRNPQLHKNCHNWFKILPIIELTPPKKMSKLFNILPKWRNFAKSGHTCYDKNIEHWRKGIFDHLVNLPALEATSLHDGGGPTSDRNIF